MTNKKMTVEQLLSRQRGSNPLYDAFTAAQDLLLEDAKELVRLLNGCIRNYEKQMRHAQDCAYRGEIARERAMDDRYSGCRD